MTGDADSGYRELLRLARAGDGTCQGQLLAMYRAYLALLARRQIGLRLQGKMDASDLVQETFLAATGGFDRFRGTTEAELVAWLRQIMASKIADSVRRNIGARCRDVRLERHLTDQLDRSSQALSQALAAPQSSPSGHAARREQAVLLADALETLPEDYREVLVLRHLEELSFPEVAQHMDRTLDSVKNLWTRALTRLRRGMGDQV